MRGTQRSSAKGATAHCANSEGVGGVSRCLPVSPNPVSPNPDSPRLGLVGLGLGLVGLGLVFGLKLGLGLGEMGFGKMGHNRFP